MSIFDGATRSLDLLQAAMHGLRVIADIARSGLDRIDASTALRAIRSIVESIAAGWRGDLEPAAIRETIEQLRISLAANDAAADAAIDRKFPT